MYIDLWDDAGPFLYRHMPENCLASFFTEERDMIQITPEGDGYWLSESRTQGADRYDTVEEAKKVGDALISSAEDALDAILLAEAGLSPESWTISYEAGLRFTQTDGPLWVTANDDVAAGRQSWDLGSGDNVLICDANDIASALAALPSER